MEEHTLRIVSHKSNARSRKEFIRYLTHPGDSREHGCTIHELAAISTTVLEYEMPERKVRINIIDYNYDAIDFKLTPDDVIYGELSKQTGQGMVDWLSAFIDKGPWVWYFSPLRGNDLSNAMNERHGYVFQDPTDDRCHGCNHIFRPKCTRNPKVHDTGYSTGTFWQAFIKYRYNITNAVQSVIKSLSRTVITEPNRISAAPWPIPEMVIKIPKYVKIESFKHNPETGELTIVFG